MTTPSRRITAITRPCDATITVPGSKSYTNRALILAALARGTSRLSGALFSDDSRYMAGALSELGVAVQGDPAASRFEVHGTGGVITRDRASVFIGNAGTAARFLPPMMALGHGSYTLDGNAAMRARPIGPLLSALRTLGAEAVSVNGDDCPPIRVDARGLRGGTARLPGGVSSQYFSALLMCAPYTREGITLEVDGDLVSKPYLDITAQAMEAFGVGMVNDGYRRFRVDGGQAYRATAYAVEPDASGASYFFAAAAVTGGKVVVPGLGSRSLQGDLGFVRILERMGCAVRQTESETEVRGAERLHGVEVDMRDLSDTAQTLAAVAPFADSPTRITGIGFIRKKETNRVAAVVRELTRLGIHADEEPDGMIIHPGMPRAGTVATYDDHRMAMSFAVLGLRAPGIEIADPGCVAKTFPDFFEVLAVLEEGRQANERAAP
jgi:3-phosphoshikimate 1-carboxyvinyltransferase